MKLGFQPGRGIGDGGGRLGVAWGVRPGMVERTLYRPKRDLWVPVEVAMGGEEVTVPAVVAVVEMEEVKELVWCDGGLGRAWGRLYPVEPSDRCINPNGFCEEQVLKGVERLWKSPHICCNRTSGFGWRGNPEDEEEDDKFIKPKEIKFVRETNIKNIKSENQVSKLSN